MDSIKIIPEKPITHHLKFAFPIILEFMHTVFKRVYLNITSDNTSLYHTKRPQTGFRGLHITTVTQQNTEPVIHYHAYHHHALLSRLVVYFLKPHHVHCSIRHEA
jgi:hypothetical protein